MQWKNSSKIEQKEEVVYNQKEQRNNQDFKKINSSETIIDVNEDEIITASTEKEISLPSKKTISLNRNNSKVDFNANPTEKKTITSSNELKKKNSAASQSGSGKSKLVALLLDFFLGVLGIHRFYLGYTGWGVLYLFTLGLFGIGVIVDFFLILFGALKPKNGDYN